MIPMESFYPRTVAIPWSRSNPGQKDSPGVVLSQDKMTHLESFYPSIEKRRWRRSIPGRNDSRDVVLSQD